MDPSRNLPLDVSRLAVLLAVLFVVGVVGGGATSWVQHHQATKATGGASIPPVSPTVVDPPSEPPASSSEPTSVSPSVSRSAVSSPTPPSRADQEQAARSDLGELSAEGLVEADPSGQWVAQLSSKYIGIVDPHQTTSSGSHTFEAVDIVAEHKAIVNKVGSTATVVLIKGSDIKKGRDESSGRLFWYTFALDDFSSRADAKEWCQSLYPALSADSLNNRCFATQLKP